MRSAGLVVLVMAAACGPGLRPQTTGAPDEAVEIVANEFLEAVQRHDQAAILASLHAPLGYGGLWFSDEACVRQFPVPILIKADRLAAFAQCLATLPLRMSSRKDALFGVAVLEYAPGIEVQARFSFGTSAAWLSWIGYSNHRDVRDALPSITGTTLDALRIAGDRNGPYTAEQRAVIEKELSTYDLRTAYAWLKVCLNADGTVTGIHPREITTPHSIDVFLRVARGWRFRPFEINGHGVPVCALALMFHPGHETSGPPAPEVLPLAYADRTQAVSVSATALHRVHGERQIIPEDDDKIAMQLSGLRRIAGSFVYCIDEHGAITEVRPVFSTGLPRYDQKIVTIIQRGWKYRPFVVDGKPIAACSAVTFVYSQR